MIDRKDARLLVKTAVIVGGSSTILLFTATVVGLAWRVFTWTSGLGV